MRNPRSIQTIPLQQPIDVNGLAGDAFTSTFKMNLVEHASVQFRFGIVVADFTITFEQDTDIAGSSADKPLLINDYFVNDTSVTPDDNWIKVKPSPKVNVFNFGSSESLTNFKFEISSGDLDTNNNYDIVKVTLALASATACLASVHADLHRLRYNHDQPPSATS